MDNLSENKECTTQSNQPAAEKRYKIAFRLMTLLVLILIAFLVGMLCIQHISIQKSAFYEDLLSVSSTTELSRGIPEKQLMINVNTATKTELTLLPGIGESRAQDIIDYRDEYGRFTQAEDLLNVKGIGQGILENIRDYIIFDDPQE